MRSISVYGELHPSVTAAPNTPMASTGWKVKSIRKTAFHSGTRDICRNLGDYRPLITVRYKLEDNIGVIMPFIVPLTSGLK
jgi:hypothetical protein